MCRLFSDTVLEDPFPAGAHEQGPAAVDSAQLDASSALPAQGGKQISCCSCTLPTLRLGCCFSALGHARGQGTHMTTNLSKPCHAHNVLFGCMSSVAADFFPAGTHEQGPAAADCAQLDATSALPAQGGRQPGYP
jgi:hypothetical protein